MSTFDLQPAAPGLLRAEAVNITLKFERTGPTTGRVSWNIPTPAAGCTAENQAYCGMLITLDTTPASMDKTPTNGQVYSSDPTVDANLFAGDKLGTALVVGGFYNDRTTTFFDVTGLMANTPYYVSGFPMDCQYRYYVEGVHAYSVDYKNRGSEGTNGTQVVRLNYTTLPNGVNTTDYTGLMPGITYDFKIQLGVEPKPNRPLTAADCVLAPPTYTVEIDGTFAQTYSELVTAINQQLALLRNCVQSPQAPNTGAYYWNSGQKKLFQWDGSTHVEVPVIYDTQTPNNVIVGTYWLNPTTNVLSVWNGSAWATVIVLETAFDPAAPSADTSYWFDGTDAYVWNGHAWCQINTLIQSTDPSLATNPPDGSYWLNTTTGVLYKWNTAIDIWNVVQAIEFDVDPNALPVNTYWFNESNNQLYAYNIPAPGWNQQANVAVTEIAPATPAPGKFWYKPTTQQLFQRNLANTAWDELDVLSFPSDPTIRSFCDLWWDTTTDELKVWDNINAVWVVVTDFFQQTTDPSSAPVIADGTAWYDSDDGVLYVWENGCFKVVEFVEWPTDPITTITTGTVWFDGTTWYVWGVSGWTAIDLITTTNDPTSLPTGTFWFNPTGNALQMWNGAAWVTVSYSVVPLSPSKGTCWFDMTVGTLKEWSGMAWAIATPLATVELDCNGNLLFTHTVVGSMSMVVLTDGTLFQSLDAPHEFYTIVPGSDGASDVPSYAEIGIGTDGSNAARDAIINDIRYELGYPVVDVELTKEQMDYAVSRALSELRSRSSIAYKRGFFFMAIKGNEQRFFLTNKISGMNKIVDILGVYRLTSAFLSSAHGAGVYGQIVLQHLYNMGTFDLLSYHIMGEYTKLMEMLFAARITYTWNEQTRELHIHHRFPFQERMVCIEATVERTEQDIMTDRYSKPWVRRYAAAVCRLILAETRGKFSALPGAGGSITLNAAELRQAAQTEMEACLQDIEDYVADKPDEYGIGTQFTFG